MRVEVLGHWAGAPADGGAASSYLIRSGATTLLLDAGPGTLPLLQARGVLREIDAVVISHMHQDHMLDLLPWAKHRQIRGIFRDPTPWRRPRLFLPEGTGRGTLDRLLAAWPPPAAASGRRPDAFADAFEIRSYGDGDVVEIGELTASFHRTSHGEECYAARLQGSATVVYTADAGYTDGLVAHSRGADVLIAEATFAAEDPYWTTQHGHMTGVLAGRLAREAGVGSLVLTHFGSDPQMVSDNLAAARREFAGDTRLAACGLQLEVPLPQPITDHAITDHDIPKDERT